MAINSYFFNAVESGGVYDRTYNAEDFTNYLNLLVGNGVFPNPSTGLQVSASSGMDVVVAAGAGWINGYKIENTAALTLTVAAANTVLNRIDNVVFYVDFVNRDMGIEIVQGTAASSPVAPTLQRDTNRYEMCLAQITVKKQVTAIDNTVITDTRANSNLCGWVQGLIQQVDTSTLFQQWQAAYQAFYTQLEAWEASMKTQFDTWLDSLTDELNVDTYIQEYTKFVQVTASDSKIIPLDMSGYTYESSDILIVALNGLLAAETYDYLLDTSQTPPELHVNLVGSTNTTDDIDIRVLKSKIGFSTTS